ncbi:hypothetical protein [Nitrosospira sp. Nsp1]|uniref:hypothetical protein n=1 Tax=Nitrosospira sp. Nsp1 TaxID=136547 RepID=UPI00088C31FF|nr:hypothetical protein SAMN05720354_11732 [Nitrosospira sp. Nsp1]
MTRSEILTEGDLKVVAEQLGIEDFDADSRAAIKARDRVTMDVESAAASNAIVVPTFFINSRMPCTTGWSRQPTDCCAMPVRDQAMWCYRSSPSQMLA